MMGIINQAINVALLLSIATADQSRIFPKQFSLGTGTAAYQTEGAWDAEGKSENIWDHWIHDDPTHIKNNATADNATNLYSDVFYNAYYLRRMGVDHYSFSIPWTRILPNGFSDQINMNAIMHYQELLHQLQIINGVTPVVTLYYNDLPQSLQDIGGWTNPNMTMYFADYARVCFQYFLDVPYWITFNDPRSICRNGYGDGSMAPGIASDGSDEYVCASTVLKAHAAAYHVYKEEFKNLGGQVSIALDAKWFEPASDKDADAVERSFAFEFGLYADPIYKGNWPKVVIDRIAERSKKEKLEKSRLPELTKEEINFINGTSDFMAVNVYEAYIVSDTDEAEIGKPSYLNDMKAKASVDPSWTLAVDGLPILPESARKTLSWLSNTYNKPAIFITENGVADDDIPTYYHLTDTTRINYYRDYLNAVLDAIIEDGVNVIGYTAWSLTDGFEWSDGYSYRHGFYFADFDSPSTLLLEKASQLFFIEILQTRAIPDAPTTTTVTSPVTDSLPTTTTGLPETTTHGSATKSALCPLLLLATIVLCNFYLK